MANIDNPTRFLPVQDITGAPWCGKANEYTVLAADGVAMFPGDAVKMTGISDTSGVPVCARCDAADVPIGIVIGFKLNRDYEGQIYRTGDTLRTALVVDDPFVYFEIQTSATNAVEDFGYNADYIATAGSTVTGLSLMELDQTTVANTASLPLRIIRLMPRENNAVGEFAKLLCKFNRHQLLETTGV